MWIILLIRLIYGGTKSLGQSNPRFLERCRDKNGYFELDQHVFIHLLTQ